MDLTIALYVCRVLYSSCVYCSISQPVLLRLSFNPGKEASLLIAVQTLDGVFLSSSSFFECPVFSECQETIVYILSISPVFQSRNVYWIREISVQFTVFAEVSPTQHFAVPVGYHGWVVAFEHRAMLR